MQIVSTHAHQSPRLSWLAPVPHDDFVAIDEREDVNMIVCRKCTKIAGSKTLRNDSCPCRRLACLSDRYFENTAESWHILDSRGVWSILLSFVYAAVVLNAVASARRSCGTKRGRRSPLDGFRVWAHACCGSSQVDREQQRGSSKSIVGALRVAFCTQTPVNQCNENNITIQMMSSLGTILPMRTYYQNLSLHVQLCPLSAWALAHFLGSPRKYSHWGPSRLE